MDIRKIEELADKFYRGDTSLKEEKLLRVLLRDDNQEKWASLKHQLIVMDRLKISEMPGKIAVCQVKVRRKPAVLTLVKPWIGVAAGLVLLMGFWWSLSINSSISDEDTFQNPVEAKQAAIEALAMASELMNSGFETTQSFQMFSQSLDKLEKLGAMQQGVAPVSKVVRLQNKGLEQVRKLELFYSVQIKLSNP